MLSIRMCYEKNISLPLQTVMEIHQLYFCIGDDRQRMADDRRLAGVWAATMSTYHTPRGASGPSLQRSPCRLLQ